MVDKSSTANSKNSLNLIQEIVNKIAIENDYSVRDSLYVQLAHLCTEISLIDIEESLDDRSRKNLKYHLVFIQSLNSIIENENDIRIKGILYNQLGNEYLKIGRIEEAIKVFFEALSTIQFVEPYTISDVSKALLIYKKLLLKHPESACLNFIMGCYSYYIDDLRNAHIFFSEALKLREDDKFYAARGLVFWKNHQFNESQKEFTNAINLAPKCAYYYRRRARLNGGSALELYHESISDLTKAIKLDPNNNCDYLDRAYTYRIIKEYNKALRDCEYVIKRNTNNIDVQSGYSILADIYNSIKVYDKAIYCCTKKIELENRCYDYQYIQRAELYEKAGLYSEAILDYTTVINLLGISDNYARRAYAYLKNKEYKKSIADFSTAIAISYNKPRVSYYVGRGNAYRLNNQHHLALIDCSEIIKTRDADYDYLNLFINICLDQKRYDDALNICDTFTVKGKNAYRERGHIYKEMKQYDKAIADYNLAMKLGGEKAHLLADIGYTYYLNNNFDEAIRHYTNALSVDPHEVKFFELRAESYIAKKSYRRAIQNYLKAIKYEKKKKQLDLLYQRIGHLYHLTKQYDKATIYCKNDLLPPPVSPFEIGNVIVVPFINNKKLSTIQITDSRTKDLIKGISHEKKRLLSGEDKYTDPALESLKELQDIILRLKARTEAENSENNTGSKE